MKPTLGTTCLTAAVALLAGLSQANAQAPAPSAPLSGAGSFPLSFVVPGTNTSLHVGGFIQLDGRYDMSAYGNSASPGADDNLAPESVEISGNGVVPNPGGHDNHGTFRLTAQNTRFSVETRTPSSYGEIKTFLEIDFAGSTSISGVDGNFNGTSGGTQTNFNFTSLARLKQAYGTLGPWLFGMTNSNFADLASWPDQLDAPVEAGGYMGAGQVKVPQVRYTYLLPAGMSLSASVESNQTGGIVATAAGQSPIAPAAGAGAGLQSLVPGGQFTTFNDFNAPGISQKFPAATATWQIQQPWGHAGFHVVLAQARITNLGSSLGGAFSAGVPQGDHISRWGYQLSQTGHFNTFGKDKITWQVQYGQGASNYTWSTNELGLQWEEDLVCSTNAFAVGSASTALQCSQPRDAGLNIGYSHWWTDEWRSGVAFGYDQVSRPNAAATWGQGGGGVAALTAGAANSLAALERKHYSADVNLMWTPVAGVQFGVEYEWYHRTVWSGAHGSSNRIESQALFAF